ncbi:hypothetical protein RB195_004507 [Necator americanus]|uniref:Uncharacterized protein n=1 Tax=Necator americanus TaxID=51031 RepID=A0ABR1BIC5_NECAM
MQLAFLDFRADFDFPHRGGLLSALQAEGNPEKFIRLINGRNGRAAASTHYAVELEVRQGAAVGPFLFTFVVDDNMERTGGRCLNDLVLALSALLVIFK